MLKLRRKIFHFLYLQDKTFTKKNAIMTKNYFNYKFTYKIVMDFITSLPSGSKYAMSK